MLASGTAAPRQARFPASRWSAALRSAAVSWVTWRAAFAHASAWAVSCVAHWAGVSLGLTRHCSPCTLTGMPSRSLMIMRNRVSAMLMPPQVFLPLCSLSQACFATSGDGGHTRPVTTAAAIEDAPVLGCPVLTVGGCFVLPVVPQVGRQATPLHLIIARLPRMLLPCGPSGVASPSISKWRLVEVLACYIECIFNVVDCCESSEDSSVDIFCEMFSDVGWQKAENVHTL
eukprot:gene13141-biopygen23025